MYSRTTFSAGLGALGVVLSFAAGWAYWQTQVPQQAWVLDRSEQIVSDVSPGQVVKAAFRLKNTSGRFLHILGCSVC